MRKKSIKFSLQLVKKALENDRDKCDWELYLTTLPRMTKETYKTFDEFKGNGKKIENTNSKILNKTKEDIIEKSQKLKKLDQDRLQCK